MLSADQSKAALKKKTAPLPLRSGGAGAAHAGFREKVKRLVMTDTTIPACSATVQKLQDLVMRFDSNLQDIAEAVKLDAGLSAKFLSIGKSAFYGTQLIGSVEEALFRIGLAEIRRHAMTIGVIDRVSRLRVKVNWDLFWFHNILTARLTEKLCGAYREVSGKEYLAGLLHDLGKLFLEHHFPAEFEKVMFRVIERGGGMYFEEERLLGVTHAEVGGWLCERWRLDPEISMAVRLHHEPSSRLMKESFQNPRPEMLLPACICVADLAANFCRVNIQGGKTPDVDFASLPEYAMLQSFPARSELDLDVEAELQKAEMVVASITHPQA